MQDLVFEVKEKPILFSGAMVRAIQDGKKTETRRVGEWWCFPGQRLWVRETFYPAETRSLVTGQVGMLIHYRADGELPKLTWKGEPSNVVWKPSIFMPRWASRITLEVVETRQERLQEITEEGAIAEGRTSVEEYRQLWDSLNEKRGYGWETNPGVTVVKFKVVSEGI